MNLRFTPIDRALELSHGQAIWLLDKQRLDITALDRCEPLLSPNERAHAQQFPRNRTNYLATRSLVRLCLAHYLGLDPREPVFDTTDKGRPFLSQPASNLDFNITHSDRWIAVALSHQEPIGIDIEEARNNNYMAIAERFFHAEEFAALSACSALDQHSLFLQLWTLKEAFFKATGGGLSAGIDKARFQFSSAGLIAHLAPELAQDHLHWRFYHQPLDNNTHLALATPAPLAIHWFNGTDLVQSQDFT